MIKLFTILLLLSLTGCATWKSTAVEISTRPYLLGVYDCSDMANEFKDLEGGSIIYARIKKSGRIHAYNLIGDYIVDCTTGDWFKHNKNIATSLLNHGADFMPGFVPQHPTDTKD